MSVSHGSTGATITPHSRPAFRIARTSPSRARGDGVPGSSDACSAGSPIAIETPSPTPAYEATADSSGRSRCSNVPFVKIDSGVLESASAVMTPGMRR